MGQATSWEFIQEGYDYYYIAHFNKPAGAVTSASISVRIGGLNAEYVEAITLLPEYNPPEGPWLGVADVLPGQQIKDVPFLNDFYLNTETPFHTGLTWLSAQSGDIQVVIGTNCYKGLDLSYIPILNIGGGGGPVTPPVGTPGYIWLEDNDLCVHFIDIGGYNKIFGGQWISENHVTGYIGVTGELLCYVNQNGFLYGQTGTLTGATGTPGCIGISDLGITWVDEYGQVRAYAGD